MKKAYLNTLTGILTFTFEGMTFNFDVSKDPKEAPQWEIIKVKSGMFDYKFEWVEDGNPTFNLYPMLKEVDETTKSPYWTIDLKKGIPLKVELSEGSKEDWFKIDFPNGFLSFTDTLSVIMRDVGASSQTFKYGGMNFLEAAREWAFEFENHFRGVKWGIDEEQGDWEEALWAFTQKKMNDY